MRLYMWHDSVLCVIWLGKGIVMAFRVNVIYIYICDIPQSYSWRDSSIHVTWLIHACAFMYVYAFIYGRALSWLLASTEYASTSETWLNHVRDIIHQYLWRDAIIDVTWLWKGVVVAFSAATTPIQSHVTCMNASCHIHGRILSNIWLSHISYINVHLYVRHDSITIYVTRCIHVYITWRWKASLWLLASSVCMFMCVTWHNHIRGMIHSYTWRDIFMCVWREWQRASSWLA